MATTGVKAWEKYFKGKTVDTKMKKDSALKDSTGKPTGKTIKAGESIKALNSSYKEDYPISIGNKADIYYVTFNNISKPIGGAVTGIKLKPQNFQSVLNNSSDLSAEDLAEALVNDLDDRDDLPEELSDYLKELAKYYGGLQGGSLQKIKQTYSNSLPGLNQVQTDYGEMLGAMACLTQGITKINFGRNPKITFPLRGNEPVADYYIVSGERRYAISAKSGDTTNTLKPGDVLSLLESNGLTSKWSRKKDYKFVQMADENTTAVFPFKAINFFYPGTLSDDAISQVESQFKLSKFSSKDYDNYLFNNLHAKLKTRKLRGSYEQPTIGKLYYDTESLVVSLANEQTDPNSLFKDATSGLVTYVRFKLNNDGTGNFDVKTGEVLQESPSTKAVKWRSKNSQNRASDKIGLQP